MAKIRHAKVANKTTRVNCKLRQASTTPTAPRKTSPVELLVAAERVFRRSSRIKAQEAASARCPPSFGLPELASAAERDRTMTDKLRFSECQKEDQQRENRGFKCDSCGYSSANTDTSESPAVKSKRGRPKKSLSSAVAIGIGDIVVTAANSDISKPTTAEEAKSATAADKGRLRQKMLKAIRQLHFWRRQQQQLPSIPKLLERRPFALKLKCPEKLPGPHCMYSSAKSGTLNRHINAKQPLQLLAPKMVKSSNRNPTIRITPVDQPAVEPPDSSRLALLKEENLQDNFSNAKGTCNPPIIPPATPPFGYSPWLPPPPRLAVDTTTPSTTRHFKCHLCYYATASLGQLQTHVKSSHCLKARQDMRCPQSQCPYRTIHLSNLRLHYQSKHGYAGFFLKCPLCHYSTGRFHWKKCNHQTSLWRLLLELKKEQQLKLKKPMKKQKTKIADDGEKQWRINQVKGVEQKKISMMCLQFFNRTFSA
jgi:hypothetical protein